MQKGKFSKGEKTKHVNASLFILRAQIKGMYKKNNTNLKKKIYNKKALETRHAYKCAIILLGVFHTPPPLQCP